MQTEGMFMRKKMPASLPPMIMTKPTIIATVLFMGVYKVRRTYTSAPRKQGIMYIYLRKTMGIRCARMSLKMPPQHPEIQR